MSRDTRRTMERFFLLSDPTNKPLWNEVSSVKQLCIMKFLQMHFKMSTAEYYDIHAEMSKYRMPYSILHFIHYCLSYYHNNICRSQMAQLSIIANFLVHKQKYKLLGNSTQLISASYSQSLIVMNSRLHFAYVFFLFFNQIHNDCYNKLQKNIIGLK